MHAKNKEKNIKGITPCLVKKYEIYHCIHHHTGHRDVKVYTIKESNQTNVISDLNGTCSGEIFTKFNVFFLNSCPYDFIA